MSGRSTRQGMTLIEVMVAMTILGMLGSLMYAGFVQTAKNKALIEEALDREQEIRKGLERMVQEISMAFISVHLNPNASLQVVKTGFRGRPEGAGSRLDFTSLSHRRLYRDAHESDQNELGYFVTRHPDGDRDVLARRMQPRLDDEPFEGGQVQILVDDVEEVEFLFLDPLSGEWVQEWDSTQPAMQPNRLPVQVKILLTVPHPNGRESEVYGTRTSIPITYAINHAAYKT